MKNWKIYIREIVIALLVGILSSLLTMGNMDLYSTINQPNLAPPSWLFPVVWTILYTLMGISSAMYFITTGKTSRIYVLQLAVNFIWPIIFFNLKAFLFAYIWLILLIGLVVLMIIQFYKANKLSGLLQIPYFIWLLFASYLNLSIYLLN